MAEITDYLNADDATAEEKLQALRDALSKSKGLAAVFSAAGPSMGGMAKQYGAQAKQDEVAVEGAPMARLKLAVEKESARKAQEAASPSGVALKRALGARFDPTDAETINQAPGGALDQNLPLMERWGGQNLLKASKQAALDARAAEGDANRQNRIDVAGVTRTSARAGGAGAGGYDKEEQKQIQNLQEKLTAPSARSPFGMDKVLFKKAERALQIPMSGGTLDLNLPKQLQEEYATAWAGIINGSNAPAQSSIKHLVPPEVMSSGPIALYQWVSGEPQGRQQQAFVKLMTDSIEREKKTLAGQMLREQISVLAGHAPALRKYHKSATPLLQPLGLDKYVNPDTGELQGLPNISADAPVPGLDSPKGAARADGKVRIKRDGQAGWILEKDIKTTDERL